MKNQIASPVIALLSLFPTIILCSAELFRESRIRVEELETEYDYTYCSSDLRKLVDRTEAFEKDSLRVFKELEQELDFIKEILAKQRPMKSSDVLGNPLISFNMISKKVKGGPALDLRFKDLFALMEKAYDLYHEFQSKAPPPTNFDLIESMESIIRLTFTYSLDIRKFAKGDLGPLGKIQGSLSPTDLFDIGLHGLEEQMYSSAVNFLDTAFQLESDETGREEIKMKLIQAITEHDDHFRLYQSNPKEFDPEEVLFQQELENLTSDSFKFRQLFRMEKVEFDSKENNSTIDIFERLCRNEDLQTNAAKSKLKCYLIVPPHHLFWNLCPLKFEVLHESPQILRIHEILTDREIDQVIEEASNSLKRSKLYGISEDGSFSTGTNRIRTSANTWIPDKKGSKFNSINQKVEQITGYRVQGILSSEDLQVASYRGGGHYSMHTDGLFEDMILNNYDPQQFEMGDRVATFMIYLSEVPLGGNTVFPLLKVGVKPVRNSAILWKNLHEDGSINPQTLHGGCPVLLGVKIVANKWIRSNDQMFTGNNCKRL